MQNGTAVGRQVHWISAVTGFSFWDLHQLCYKVTYLTHAGHLSFNA
jgi:hypothetical protein